MNESERAVAMGKLHEAQNEAMRVQMELDDVDTAIREADAVGNHPTMARLYQRETDLLLRRLEASERVAAIAAALWLPNDEAPLRLDA